MHMQSHYIVLVSDPLQSERVCSYSVDAATVPCHKEVMVFSGRISEGGGLAAAICEIIPIRYSCRDIRSEALCLVSCCWVGKT